MGKEQNKKITLQELIERKEQAINAKKNPKRADLYVKSLDGIITIEEPSACVLQDALKMDEKGDQYIVYQCCVEPKLKDSDLLKAYNVAEPLDIVDYVFEPGEVKAISIKCAELAGYVDGNVKLIKKIKN